MVGRLPYRVGMDWQRLADVIRGELAKRGWTQKDLADRAEVDIKTISLLLNAHPRSRLPRSIPRVEAALGWAPGSARAVLEGDVLVSDERGQIAAQRLDIDLRASSFTGSGPGRIVLREARRPAAAEETPPATE